MQPQKTPTEVIINFLPNKHTYGIFNQRMIETHMVLGWQGIIQQHANLTRNPSSQVRNLTGLLLFALRVSCYFQQELLGATGK